MGLLQFEYAEINNERSGHVEKALRETVGLLSKHYPQLSHSTVETKRYAKQQKG